MTAATSSNVCDSVAAKVRTDVPADGCWYHVTHEQFDHFDLNAEPNTFDWNTGLGVHFSRDGDGSRDYFVLWPETGRVIQAALEIGHPARYESEHDLDFHALRMLRAEGLTLEQLDLERRHVLFDDDWARLRQWFDCEPVFCYDDQGLCWCRDLVLANSHQPQLRARAAELVRSDLLCQGFDGIVYGNEIDFACVSAIAFHPEQITVIDGAWRP